MKMILETTRLILRPFTMNDVEAMYYGWASDPDVTKYLTWNTHRNLEDTKNIISLWVEQYEKPERINFAIVLKETLELIGGIDVCGYIDGVPVIGYTLAKKHWNKGYMSEAFNEVINFLFSIGHKIIRVDAMVENIGSNKVIIKCGGKYIDTVDEVIPLKNKTVKINRYQVIKE